MARKIEEVPIKLWRRKGVIRTAEDLFEHVQVVERRRPERKIYQRAAPRTILFPMEGQLEIRMKFGELAKRAEGKKGLSPLGIPWAAYFIKQGLKGYKAKRRIVIPKTFQERLRKREELRRLTHALLIH